MKYSPDSDGQKAQDHASDFKHARPSIERQQSTAADELLDILGYQSELTRSRSTLTVAFMSFVLASVPYGLSTTLYYPLVAGGPVNIIWGWVTVCAIVMCLAISLAEITSVYPTAGGVYYQTFMLAPHKYRNIMAWLCGWAYFLGNLMITLAVNFGTTLLIVGCVNVFTDSEGNGIWDAKNYHYYLTFAIFWTFSGVIAIIVCALAIAKEGRHNASYVFGSFENSSGWPDGWAFFIGLLHGAYATSGTGMILSMCEEVREPATQVPKAMTRALVMNFLCGFIFLVPLVFVLPDIATILASPYAQPLPVILSSAVGNQAGAFALTIPIMVLGILCGTCCTTASSRCAWAFARDNAIPGSGWWKIVNKKLDVPLNAMMMIMVAELLLGLIWFGSTAAFNAFSGCGVIFLTIAYVMPIIMSVLRNRRDLKNGCYDFKMFGWICNIVSIAWSLLVTPLFSMPAVIPINSQTMNYASVVFAGGMLISLLWYFIWGAKNYKGPPAKDEDEIVRRRSSLIEYRHSFSE
ncbi:hypothetical protein DV735_g4822, partial [Chaetothyriales sp. CBS 134920]